jgi:hypothetical protein
MSSHLTNSSLCPLATFFSAPSGVDERKTAMTSLGSIGAGLRLCGSNHHTAGTRHPTQTSNENIANAELFMVLLDLEPSTTCWTGQVFQNPESVLALRRVMRAALVLGGLALVDLYCGVMSRNKHHNF